MKRRLSSGAIQRSGLRRLIALCVLSLTLVPSGCGGGEEPVGPSPGDEPTPVTPPPPEPEPEPEPGPAPGPGPDISAVRVPADQLVWSPDHVGVLLGLDGGLYEGYNPATVARIQQALSDQGFYPGEVDSNFDRDTMEAVADYQAEYELHLTGVPTPHTRLALRSIVSIADESSVQSDQVFLVQVGVFSNPMNSERLTNRLRELSFEVQTNTEGGLRIVRVGPFQDRRMAEEAADAIEEATGLSPLVMRN